MNELAQITINGLHNLQAHLLIMQTIFKNTIKNTVNTPTYRLNNRDLLPHQNRVIKTIWEKESVLRS